VTLLDVRMEASLPSCVSCGFLLTNTNSNGVLVGFEFEMKACRDNKQRILKLTESDLRRIGLTLAEMYCDALGRSDSFIEDARSMGEESNAT
jgi:hypothetical protein